MNKFFFAFLTAASFLCGSAWAGEPIFSDDFSAPEILLANGTSGKPGWKVLKGKFAVDGSDAAGNYRPAAGQLNFGVTPGAAIALDLNEADARAFRRLDFQLRQSNDGQGTYVLFTVRLEDTSVEGGYYDAKLSLSPVYFNNTGYGGYAYNNLEKTGTPDEALQMGSSAFQAISVRFDPSSGVIVSVNGMDVLEIPNKFDLDKINRITLISETGDTSWFVDDVVVSKE